MDDRVPERRDSHASSSHEPSLEPTPTRSAKTLDRVTSTCRSTASVVEDANVDRQCTRWHHMGGSLASPYPIVGASRTRLLAHMYGDIAALLLRGSGLRFCQRAR